MKPAALRGAALCVGCALLALMCAFLLPGRVSAAGASRPDAPAFALKSVDGRGVTLSSLRGNVVLLNFWALWCPPCKAELPSMDRLQRAFKDKGLVVVAVTNDNPESVRRYVEDFRYGFVVLLDTDSKVYDAYRVFMLPTSYLIDRQGKVVGKFTGQRDWIGPQAVRDIEVVLASPR